MHAKSSPESKTERVLVDFEALADRALANLKGARDLGVVCGPLSTGGTGNTAYNFQVFNAVIRGLEHRGLRLFNQVPYESDLRQLAIRWEKVGNEGYCMPILTVFYARIFASGAITRAWFIPGWQSSLGACWERERMLLHNYLVHDLARHEVEKFLLMEYEAEHARLLTNLLAPT